MGIQPLNDRCSDVRLYSLPGGGAPLLRHPRFCDVRDQVTESISVDDLPFQLPTVPHTRPRQLQPYVIVDRRPHRARLDAARQPCRHGGKDVAAVEGAADRLPKVCSLRSMNHPEIPRLPQHRSQHPVVRRDEDVFRGLGDDRSSRPTHTGVDNHEKDGL
jgi:hypothetical protein